MADAKQPYGDVAYADPGYQKDGKKRYPIDTEEHVRAAWSYINQGDNASQYSSEQLASIKGRIKSAAKKFGIEISSDSSDSSGRTRVPPTPYMRSFVLESVDIKPGDGRTVEAYAAVFNVPAKVHDPDGRYEEIIDPGAFNRTLEHRRRAKNGAALPVLFNHGMTIWGTPSERYSVPIGVSEEVRVDGNGLFTRSRFHRTQAADEVLEAIKDGSVTGYSFRGDFLRSEPPIPHGGFRAGRNGELKTVHRTEVTLDEYGPGTFPVYQGAEITSVRAASMLLSTLTPDEAVRFVEMFRSGTPLDPPDDGTPSDEGPAAEDPPPGHSIRSVKDEIELQRARFILRQRERQAQRARALIDLGAMNG